MNFNLRKQLQQNRDSDSTLDAPFTQEQEKRLQELIRAEISKVLGARPSAPRTRIGLDGEKDRFEERLRQAAEQVGAVPVSDMHKAMQEVAEAAAKEARQRVSGATDAPAAGVQPLQEPEIAEDELSSDEWDIVTEVIEKEVNPFNRKQAYYAKAVIQRKDRRMFQSLVDKKIKLAGQLFTIIGGRMTHLVNTDGSASTSAYVLCKFEGEL